MRANRKKLELAMAKACMTTAELQKASGLKRPTLNNVITSRGVTPATLGKVAKALNVDVEEILEEEEQDEGTD